MTDGESVAYEVDDRVAVLTIDRPQARNAVTPEVAHGLEALQDRAEADPDVWVLVLTGAPPVFCAGADLKAIGAGRAWELETPRGGYAGITRRARTKPLIAAVEGAALAGGAEIVLSCDVTRGLVAAAGGLFRLGRRIPLNLAMEAALTGDPIDAETAHRHGLVNRLCEPGQARECALDLARRIAANAPLAVRESRAIVAECTGSDDASGWERSTEAALRVLGSHDVQEGVRAFVEKRSPAWAGR
jgi:enoyl-CoA hydratase